MFNPAVSVNLVNNGPAVAADKKREDPAQIDKQKHVMTIFSGKLSCMTFTIGKNATVEGPAETNPVINVTINENRKINTSGFLIN